MKYFSDCIGLILYGFLALFYVEPDLSFLVAVLCAVVMLCCSYVIEKTTVRQAVLVLFAFLFFLNPAVFFFYPLLLYLLLRENLWFFSIVAWGIFLGTVPGLWAKGTLFATAGTAGIFLAWLLEKRTSSWVLLEEKLRRIKDDSEEKQLLLAQKNKALQEKQDYEIYNATLQERNRIAREIHDNVGHVLSRSILMVGAAKTINKDAGLSPLLENLEDSLNGAMGSIRTSVHDLHDEAVNLEETEKSLVKEFTFCPVSFTYDMSRTVPREVKYCFISITKEAFSNIIRHSNATQVSLILREHPALYQLCIEDNGTGGTYKEGYGGIGIANMRERIEGLKGTMQISLENGFRIFITIPRQEQKKNENSNHR